MAIIAIRIISRNAFIPTFSTDLLFYKSDLAINTATQTPSFFFLLTALTQGMLAVVAHDLILFEGQLFTRITNLFLYIRASFLKF